MLKRRATAVLKSDLIRSIEFGTAVARRLKPALETKLLAEVLFIPAGDKVCIQSKQTDDITEMALFYRLLTGGTLTLFFRSKLSPKRRMQRHYLFC